MLVKRHTWQTVASALGACIVGYFLFHTIQGERGWLAMVRLERQVNAAQSELSQLQKEQASLGHKVQLMNPASLDPDLLDQQSRELLDYSKPNDIIVLMPSQDSGALSQRSNFRGE
ncbi:MAG TPA: septum formation initiator family protein [Alphaproteobacteria bacterium]|nr:septum formation initiator family protein [Alphaproteobacteria bacterium]